MSLKERLNQDLKEAIKSGDSARRDVLRMLKAKVLEKEVELRSRKGRDYVLQDDEVIDVISSYAKQRQQSISAYREGGREDLATREEAELKLLQPYLPEQLSEDELEEIIRSVIEQTGASSPRDMGAVMRAVMAEVKGKADGKLVNQKVRELLS